MCRRVLGLGVMVVVIGGLCSFASPASAAFRLPTAISNPGIIVDPAREFNIRRWVAMICIGAAPWDPARTPRDVIIAICGPVAPARGAVRVAHCRAPPGRH